jgi:hypothetical protein
MATRASAPVEAALRRSDSHEQHEALPRTGGLVRRLSDLAAWPNGPDQAAILTVVGRRAMRKPAPTMPKPRIIIAQVAGSGTAPDAKATVPP